MTITDKKDKQQEFFEEVREKTFTTAKKSIAEKINDG